MQNVTISRHVFCHIYVESSSYKQVDSKYKSRNVILKVEVSIEPLKRAPETVTHAVRGGLLS